MSITLIVSQKSSHMTVNYFPPIELEQGSWEVGMLNFESYHSMPNVKGDESILEISNTNNTNAYGGFIYSPITISTGNYEIHQLEKAINDEIKPEKVEISVNEASLKSKFKSSVAVRLSDQMRRILGFTKDVVFDKNVSYESDNPVNINTINVINIDCSIASGSYLNQEKGHIIHSFFPNVPHGFKIVEVVENIIYHKLTSNLIESLTLRIEDQEGSLIDFGEETITVRLHLRKRS